MVTEPRPAPLDYRPVTESRGSLWRHPDFLKLWAAETVSQFGTQVSLLAVPLVAVLPPLSASPFEVALLGTIEFLPFILFTLPAGAWVDRLRRRPILIVGDLGRAISLATIPLAYAFGGVSIGQLYIVGFINGTLTVFFDVAYQSYLPSLVDREQLVEGNSKLQTTVSAAQIAGPGIAGYLVGILKAPFAILVDSVSFVFSAAFVFLIRRPEPPVERHVDEDGRRRGSIVSEVREGLRFVLGNRSLRAIAAGTSSSNLFGQFAFATYLVFVVRELGLVPEQIGVVFALGNVGTLAGAVLAHRLSSWFGLGRTIIGSLFLGGFSVLLLALAPTSDPIPFLVASGVVGGMASMVYNINQVSYRQAICPPPMQGRMNATMRFLVWGTIPIGGIIGGILATQLGLRQAIWIGAVLSLLPALPILLSPVRSLRTMPEPARDES
jgi:MFS family permease